VSDFYKGLMMALKDSLSKIGDTLGNITGNLVKVFDNGSEIYLSVRERINAFKQIEAETVNPQPAVIAEPSLNLKASERTKTLLGALGLIVAGVVVVKVMR